MRPPLSLARLKAAKTNHQQQALSPMSNAAKYDDIGGALSALADGVRDAAGLVSAQPAGLSVQTVHAPLNDMGVEELQRRLPLSLLKKRDGGLLFVPKTKPIQTKQAIGEVQVKTNNTGKPTGQYISLDQLSANVKAIVWGALTVGGARGSEADGVQVAGLRAVLSPTVGARLG